MKKISTCVALFTVLSVLPYNIGVRGADWPQWQGPNRDGVWHEQGIVDGIPENGLPIVWRVPLGGGYSGPAVAGDHLYVADYIKSEGNLENNPNNRSLLSGTERVLCFDTTTGEEIWKYEYDCPYSISYAAGPRCTPTVYDDRVYALGSEGNFLCLNAQNGKLLWEKDFKKDYDLSLIHI